MIDIEKIDPFNEEDWDEKDIIFNLYGYRFRDSTRTIDISPSIRTNTFEIECTDDSISTYYQIKSKISDSINTIVRNNNNNREFYREFLSRLRASKNGMFSFSINKRLFDGGKNNYFLNPLKEYEIFINKNNLSVDIKSKYKWGKTNYKFYNEKRHILVIFGYLDAKKGLKKLDRTFNKHIEDVMLQFRQNNELMRMRRNYKINIID